MALKLASFVCCKKMLHAEKTRLDKFSHLFTLQPISIISSYSSCSWAASFTFFSAYLNVTSIWPWCDLNTVVSFYLQRQRLFIVCKRTKTDAGLASCDKRWTDVTTWFKVDTLALCLPIKDVFEWNDAANGSSFIGRTADLFPRHQVHLNQKKIKIFFVQHRDTFVRLKIVFS